MLILLLFVTVIFFFLFDTWFRIGLDILKNIFRAIEAFAWLALGLVLISIFVDSAQAIEFVAQLMRGVDQIAQAFG